MRYISKCFMTLVLMLSITVLPIVNQIFIINPLAAVNLNADYIFPDSDSRYLTDEEINSLSKDEARLAVNEIAARHGRQFKDTGLQVFFNSKSWYSGTVDPSVYDASADFILNEYEKINSDRLTERRNGKALTPLPSGAKSSSETQAAAETKQKSSNNSTSEVNTELNKQSDTPIEYVKKNYPLATIYEYSYPTKFKKEREKVFELLKTLDEYNVLTRRDDKAYGVIPGSVQVSLKSGTYTETLKHTGLYYYGDMKNSKPNGWGMLYKNNSTDCFKFATMICQFKDGKPKGYAASFDEMSGIDWECSDIAPPGFLSEDFLPGGDLINYYTYRSAERNILMSYIMEEADIDVEGSFFNNEILSYYHLILPPAVFYEGKAKKGAVEGKGKEYYDIFEFDKNLNPTMEAKEPCYGRLLYEGEFKNGDRSGKGKLYYFNEKLQYEGELKHGVYDGKGTLYNEDGSIKHKGTFKNGDIK